MGCGSSSSTGKAPKVNLKTLQKKTGLPMKFLEKKYAEFMKFDGDGRISSSQFVDFMTDSDDSDLKHFLQQMFKAFDMDKSGNMDFNEMMMMVGKVTHGSTQDKLRAVFQLCDEDRSGRIEKKELKHTFENLTFLVREDGVDKDTMGDLAETVFDETDKDGNGHLTREEFIIAFAAHGRVEEMIKAIFVGLVAALVID